MNLDQIIGASLEGKQIRKTADFPDILTQLERDYKQSISRSYSVGPNSTVTEIPIAHATKKPYSEQLLVYTINTLTSKQQDTARDELRNETNKIDRELATDQEYARIKGSVAGNEYRQIKIDEVQKTIDQKYTPKEQIVAWGEGTYFHVNQKMFQYHYHSRRPYSDAPSNRKSLLEYLTSHGGKVYYISKDQTLDAIRQERRNQRSIDTKNPYVQRAQAFADKKLNELKQSAQQLLAKQTQQFNANLDGLLQKVVEGQVYSSQDASKTLMNKIALDTIGALGHVFWQVKSYTGNVTDKEGLMRFVKEINSAIARAQQLA